MARIFRALLIAAVNAIQEFFAFATDNGESQVGDSVKLNDGMATSNYDWSAYPSDTITTGTYTQTGTIEKVKQIGNDFAYGMQEPEQDNKDVKLQADKVYYAYTNENDSTDTLYANDNPISESPTPSILYENTGTTEFVPTALDPQPTFTVQNEGLQNATVVGALTENNGVYSGFTSTNVNYVRSTNNFNPSENWEVGLDFITANDVTSAQDVSSLNSDYSWSLGLKNGKMSYFFSTNGTSWTTNAVNGTNTISANTHYQIKFVYDYVNESGVVYIKSDNDADFVQDYTTGKVMSKDNYIKYGLGRGGGGNFLGSIDMKNTYYKIGNTTTNFYNSKEGIVIENDLYERNSDADDVKSISGVSVDIETIDNTTIQTVTITSDQTAEIETSTNVTTDNNGVVITDGSRHNFNITVPSSLVSIMQSGGQQYNVTYCPYTFKTNSGVGLLLKNGNDVYYRNSWIMTRDYDLHYQQINFSYPSGATVTCRVNNVLQNDLTPYCYAGDTITWTCDNAGTVTTGSYTVKYSSKDGNIQTITIS